MYVLDLENHKLERRIQTRGRIYSSPNMVDGNVIFGNTAGVIEEINAQSLETEYATLVPDAITCRIAVSTDQSIIYVPTYMNEVYAIQRSRQGATQSRRRESATPNLD